MSRPLSAVELEVLASEDYYPEVQLFLGDTPAARTYVPALYVGADPVEGLSVVGDIEQVVTTAEIVVTQGTGRTSLSPYAADGIQLNGRPVFDPGRYLTVMTRLVGRYRKAPPADLMPWRGVFDGRIDAADPQDDGTVHVHCRDWYCDWLDRWIRPNPVTGSWAIPEGDWASVFDDIFALGWLEGWPLPPGQSILQTVGSPTLLVPAYNQEPMSGLLALRTVALLSGWDLRGRWWSPAGGGPEYWTLVYSEPDRALAGVQNIYGPNRQYAFRAAPKSRDDVRNYVQVTPSDPPRNPMVQEDPTSQLNYGFKPLFLAEDEQSRIRTPEQAQALAVAILSDTAEPKITAQVDLNFQPTIEVNDVLRFLANGSAIDRDLVTAVATYRHDLLTGPEGFASTTVGTRDAPAAANQEWLKTDPKQRYTSLYPPSGVAAEGARWLHVTDA